MVTTVTSSSWISNIIQAFLGLLIAPVVGLVGCGLLFWNEGDYLHTAYSLDEGEKVVVSIDANTLQADREGKLVHLSGKMKVDGDIGDPDFGVKVPAIKVRRIAEMYQWEEDSHTRKRKKFGGGTETVTEYTYDKQWSESVINSQSFRERAGHENPLSMPFRSDEWQASPVRLGAFTLAQAQLDKLNNFETLSLPAWSIEQLPAGISPRPAIVGDDLYLPVEWLQEPAADAGAESGPVSEGEPSPEAPESPAPVPGEPAAPASAPQTSNRSVSPSRVNTPQVGDVRVRFEYVPVSDVTIVAKQQGDTFTAYETKAKARNGIMFVSTGVKTPKEMFDNARFLNTAGLWGFRMLGAFLNFFAVGMFLRPIRVFAQFIPFLGQLVGFALFFFSVVASGGVTVMVVGVAWLYYRPVLGILICLLGFVAIAGMVMLLQFRKAAQTPSPLPEPIIVDR